MYENYQSPTYNWDRRSKCSNVLVNFRAYRAVETIRCAADIPLLRCALRAA